MEFSSPATQRSPSSSEPFVIQPGSVRSPAVDAANDFARHLAENNKHRSDRRDDRPVERRERSAASEPRNERAARETARDEDRDREIEKAGTGESSSATTENAAALETEIAPTVESTDEASTVAAEEFVNVEENDQAPVENETDTTDANDATDAIAAAIPTMETSPAKTLAKSTSPITPAAIDGTGKAAAQQAAAPTGPAAAEGQTASAAQAGEKAPPAADSSKTQTGPVAQAPNSAQAAAQASSAGGATAEQIAAADAEAAPTKSGKTEKGLGQKAAEKLAERKSGDRQTASQINAVASAAVERQTARSVTPAPQITQGAIAPANAGAPSSDLPLSAVQQSANAGGAATVRIGTLPGQSQPTQLPANAIALQMARNLQKGMSRFDIRLDPPEMGRIDVRMEVRKDGHVVAHMTVDRPETLDLLQRDARALQQALNNAGLQADNDSLNFSLRDQNESGGERDLAGSGNSAASSGDTEIDPPLAQIYNVNLATNGGVDIRI